MSAPDPRAALMAALRDLYAEAARVGATTDEEDAADVAALAVQYFDARASYSGSLARVLAAVDQIETRARGESIERLVKIREGMLVLSREYWDIVVERVSPRPTECQGWTVERWEAARASADDLSALILEMGGPDIDAAPPANGGPDA